jgi:hypothetical protein
MKFFKLFGIFFLLHYSILAQNLSGHIKLSNQILKDLSILGVADLNKLSVNYLDVVGALNFYKFNAKTTIAGTGNGNIGNFDTLIIKGSAKLKNITSDTLNISSRDDKSKISIIDSLINHYATLESSSINIINSAFNELTITAEIIYLTDIKAQHLIIDTKNDVVVNIIEKMENTTDIKNITFTHEGRNFIKLPKKFQDNHHNIIKNITGAKIKYAED